MKVLMTADTVGGVWTRAMDLCRALEAHGVQVLLATMGRIPSPSQREQAQSCENVELRESCYALEWMENPWNDIRDAARWLLELRDEFEPDVIHLNGYCHAPLDWERPVLVTAHCCMLSWWEAVKHEPAPRSWNTYRQKVREGLHAADMVVTPTQTMLDCLHRHYGMVRWPRVIASGRDPAMYAPSAKRDIVLSVGRMWDEARNLSVLEKAARRVRWPIHVVGSREHPDGRRLYSSAVNLLGVMEPRQLARVYAEAGIYALPARYEPSGLSVAEAALSGCTLVLGDIPGLREIWGEAATYISPDDAGAWSREINALANDAIRRLGLGQLARQRALQLAPAATARAYKQAYDELLRGRRQMWMPSGVAPRVMHA